VAVPSSGVETKLNAGAHLPLSSDIKTTSKFQCLLGEVVLSNFAIQEHDSQTHKEKTQRFSFIWRHEKSEPEPHQTWYDNIENLEQVLAPPKCFAV